MLRPKNVKEKKLDLITLNARQYIFACKHHQIDPNLICYKQNLKSLHQLEMETAVKEKKIQLVTKKWKPFFNP